MYWRSVAAILGDDGDRVCERGGDVTGEADADVGLANAGVLGLPDTVTAGLFDLDGVLTNTAAVHDRAWKETFDAFLWERAERTDEFFIAFDPMADYLRYVDGKPRAEPRCSRTPLLASRPAGAGGFGFVVGVDRTGEADALREHGADIVVSDLAELLGRASGEADR
jgi:beta-phosphoglucomutase-like phosphatase (HAD superfamily)